MNELRLILLGIGLLVIAGIYMWDVYKSRKEIRSKIEKKSPSHYEFSEKIEITPKHDFDYDDLEAMEEFKDYLNKSRKDNPETEAVFMLDQEPESELVLEPDQSSKKSKPGKQEPGKDSLIVLYLMADKNKPYTGMKILDATKAVGMKYGSMDIFHFYESGEVISKKALFSLVNIVEPGLFDLKRMEHFKTHGLALFMQKSSSGDDEHIFDLLLDTAWKLVEILGGELQDDQHNVVDPLIVNSLREKLYS